MLFNPKAVEGLGRVWDEEISRKDRHGEEDKGRGKHARGPVAAVIATPSELGWQERGPDRWIIE
eukprot:15427632-Heterocapsa_arctica.AAC.1